ncbi:hypothetical protein C8F04DRAFT_1177489 [Mycena alexandri]|uniref:Uncharacterized protein n=1 Tax=Mycena alexandri TaxID=1745969 RepID=A0AAD6X6J1_9AGAR|nr:hypothetical protein C8F04DRAFT_1177489 [Mycena alexandri]
MIMDRVQWLRAALVAAALGIFDDITNSEPKDKIREAPAPPAEKCPPGGGNAPPPDENGLRAKNETVAGGDADSVPARTSSGSGGDRRAKRLLQKEKEFASKKAGAFTGKRGIATHDLHDAGNSAEPLAPQHCVALVGRRDVRAVKKPLIRVVVAGGDHEGRGGIGGGGGPVLRKGARPAAGRGLLEEGVSVVHAEQGGVGVGGWKSRVCGAQMRRSGTKARALRRRSQLSDGRKIWWAYAEEQGERRGGMDDERHE